MLRLTCHHRGAAGRTPNGGIESVCVIDVFGGRAHTAPSRDAGTDLAGGCSALRTTAEAIIAVVDSCRAGPITGLRRAGRLHLGAVTRRWFPVVWRRHCGLPGLRAARRGWRSFLRRTRATRAGRMVCRPGDAGCRRRCYAGPEAAAFGCAVWSIGRQIIERLAGLDWFAGPVPFESRVGCSGRRPVVAAGRVASVEMSVSAKPGSQQDERTALLQPHIGVTAEAYA